MNMRECIADIKVLVEEITRFPPHVSPRIAVTITYSHLIPAVQNLFLLCFSNVTANRKLDGVWKSSLKWWDITSCIHASWFIGHAGRRRRRGEVWLFSCYCVAIPPSLSDFLSAIITRKGATYTHTFTSMRPVRQCIVTRSRMPYMCVVCYEHVNIHELTMKSKWTLWLMNVRR